MPPVAVAAADAGALNDWAAKVVGTEHPSKVFIQSITVKQQEDESQTQKQSGDINNRLEGN